MVRLWTAVLGMEIVAVAVAVFGFGWLVLLAGVPLIIATVLIIAVVKFSEIARSRRALREHKRDPERTVYVAPIGQRGLMSGFFDLSKQEGSGPVGQ